MNSKQTTMANSVIYLKAVTEPSSSQYIVWDEENGKSNLVITTIPNYFPSIGNTTTGAWMVINTSGYIEEYNGCSIIRTDDKNVKIQSSDKEYTTYVSNFNMINPNTKIS